MFENFTRRHRLDYEPCNLRYEYIPSSFKFDLIKLVSDYCNDEGGSVSEYCLYRGASVSINKDHYQLFGVDDIHEYYTPDLLIDLIQKSEWHEALSIIEYLIIEGPLNIKEVNDLFEYHSIGYEVEESLFNEPVKIIVKYSTVIEENDRALEAEIEYDGVKASIETAKKALIDPQNVDIELSIKSSVGAIEGYLRGWLAEKGYKKIVTLGDAVKVIKKEKLVQDNIVESLHQFYIYRNRTENIGHGAPNLADVSVGDALLFNEMAISFVNYFHRLSDE